MNGRIIVFLLILVCKSDIDNLVSFSFVDFLVLDLTLHFRFLIESHFLTLGQWMTGLDCQSANVER